jgi:hypothetical protein
MDYNWLMWILLLLFSAFLMAQDETVTEKYCFSSTDILVARKKLNMIEVRSDSVSIDGNCLVSVMKSHRRELIQKYLISNFEDMSITFSSEEMRKEPCKLKIEKEKINHALDLDINLNQNKVHVNAINSGGQESEEMQIQTIKEFQLSVDQAEVIGKCTSLNPDRYIVAIEVKKNPKPLGPQNLPQGSVIIMNQPPAEQETMLMKTEVQLSRGERINLGEIVKNLKKEKKSGEIPASVGAETQNHKQTEKVFLSIQ